MLYITSGPTIDLYLCVTLSVQLSLCALALRFALTASLHIHASTLHGEPQATTGTVKCGREADASATEQTHELSSQTGQTTFDATNPSDCLIVHSLAFHPCTEQ